MQKWTGLIIMALSLPLWVGCTAITGFDDVTFGSGSDGDGDGDADGDGDGDGDGDACIDEDGDGYGENCAAGEDCDDSEERINPEAEEICDDVDNNCNDEIDEGCEECVPEGEGCDPDDPDVLCCGDLICNDAGLCESLGCLSEGSECNPDDPDVICCDGLICDPDQGLCLEDAGGEVCDRVDNNSDGFIDEGRLGLTTPDPLSDVFGRSAQISHDPLNNVLGAVWINSDRVVTLAAIELETGSLWTALVGGATDADVCFDGHHWTVVLASDFDDDGNEEGIYLRFDSESGGVIRPSTVFSDPPGGAEDNSRVTELRCSLRRSGSDFHVGIVWNRRFELDGASNSEVRFTQLRSEPAGDGLIEEMDTDVVVFTEPAVVTSPQIEPLSTTEWVLGWTRTAHEWVPGERPSSLFVAAIDNSGGFEMVTEFEMDSEIRKDRLDMALNQETGMLGLVFLAEVGGPTGTIEWQYSTADMNASPPWFESWGPIPETNEDTLEVNIASAGYAAFGLTIGVNEPFFRRVSVESGDFYPETLPLEPYMADDLVGVAEGDQHFITAGISSSAESPLLSAGLIGCR